LQDLENAAIPNPKGWNMHDQVIFTQLYKYTLEEQKLAAVT